MFKISLRNVTYESLGDVVNYQTFQPWNYEDIRGAEISLSKNRGRWLRGFINYTFLTRKDGNFGFARFDENTFQQREYIRNSTDFRVNDPVAEPICPLQHYAPYTS